MVTTIQVDEDTMSFLKHLKEQYNASSYDVTIKLLIEKAMKPAKSLARQVGR